MIVVLGCMIGIGAGRLFTGQPLFTAPQNAESTAEQSEDDTENQLNEIQNEMNEATAKYIKQQEEAKKAEEEAQNEVPEKTTPNSGGNSDRNNGDSGSSTPQNATGDAIEGLDDDYYDDYTEDMNVETPPSDSPRISLDSLGDDIITGPIDFGDPNEHQSNWDSFEPTVDMSGWNGTFH